MYILLLAHVLPLLLLYLLLFCKTSLNTMLFFSQHESLQQYLLHLKWKYVQSGPDFSFVHLFVLLAKYFVTQWMDLDETQAVIPCCK